MLLLITIICTFQHYSRGAHWQTMYEPTEDAPASVYRDTCCKGHWSNVKTAFKKKIISRLMLLHFQLLITLPLFPLTFKEFLCAFTIVHVQKTPQTFGSNLTLNCTSHLSRLNNNTCMHVGKEWAIRTVKCAIRFALCYSFWHFGHLWWVGLVAPWHTGCVFGRRSAHPPLCFSPFVTIWRGNFAIRQQDSFNHGGGVADLSPSVLFPSDGNPQLSESKIIWSEHTPPWEYIYIYF